METLFSKTLVQLRKKAGYPTAYRFFHDSGGQQVLKLTYRSYLFMEQGRTLPPLERFGVLIYALRLVQRSAEANGLVSAWLQTLAGPERYRDLLEPLLAARQQQGLTPAQSALRNARTKRTLFLTHEQYKTIYASFENYLCYCSLSNDGGEWTPKSFAAAFGLAAPAAAKALKDLARVKILRPAGKGAYTCPSVNMMRRAPERNTLPADLVSRIAEYGERLKAMGHNVFKHRVTLRVDETAFRDFLPLLEEAVLTSDSYSVHEKTGASALYVVDAAVTKVRDF